MSTLKFSITINAARAKVWEKLWNDDSYRKWTAAFAEGSYAQSDWKEGGKILFLSPDGSGMFGIIEKKIPNEQMIFRQLGEVKNGIEEPKYWGAATESYYLEETNGVTRLNVEMVFIDEFAQYLSKVFPKALEVLKQISEE
ncbi:MAG: SRPBCC domain-containing protein [Chitinophagales bacterium]|nr:SRPBCC domain-containing protein [Chitinophagales bacterium]